MHAPSFAMKTRSIYTGICIVYHVVPIISAENEGVNWPTVAVAWTFSLVTSILVVIVALVVTRYLRYKKKQRHVPPRMSRELSVLSEVSDMTHSSQQSGQPLYTATGYRRVPSRESGTNRRKSDFVSSWCGKHGLSEVIAANLRENGFHCRGQIEALQPGDVMTLGLSNLAQQVQLRKVLENMDLEKKELQGTDQRITSSQPRSGSGSSDWNRPRSSATNDESSFANTPSPKQALPTEPISFSYTDRGQSPESLPQHVPPVYKGTTKHPRLRFNGLLSDSGLYELAESLGTEWRHLAVILGIPKAQQEHLMNDFPANTKQQIFEMLRLWRENEKGGKEQVKAVLSEAFRRVKRKDLSDRILREQVHGSDEHLRGPPRVNSVV